MEIKLSHCFISVHDQEVALTFYRDALGLQVLQDAKFETMRWLSVGSPAQPDVEIVLMVPTQVNPVPDHGPLMELLAKGSLNGVIFRIDNCDATFEKLRTGGFEVLQEPIDQAYGVRDCAFRDPSGNSVRFSQVLDG